MQPFSGQLGTVPEPNTFITWVSVSQHWLCDIGLFPKVSINVVKSLQRRGSWYRNMTGENFFKLRAIRRCQEIKWAIQPQCRKCQGSIWEESIYREELAPGEYPDVTAFPGPGTRQGLIHGDPRIWWDFPLSQSWVPLKFWSILNWAHQHKWNLVCWSFSMSLGGLASCQAHRLWNKVSELCFIVPSACLGVLLL